MCPLELDAQGLSGFSFTTLTLRSRVDVTSLNRGAAIKSLEATAKEKGQRAQAPEKGSLCHWGSEVSLQITGMT